MSKQERIFLYLSLSLVIVGLIGGFFFRKFALEQEHRELSFIGIVYDVKGSVKTRYGGTISWRSLEEKDPLFSKSYLFTGEKSSGKFVFLDGSVINLKGNTMIYLEKNFKDLKSPKNKDSSLKMDFVDGEINIDLKDNSKIDSIQVQDTRIEVDEGKAKFSLKNNFDKNDMTVSVLEGGVDISRNNKSFRVQSGEKLAIANNDRIRRKTVDRQSMDTLKKEFEKYKKVKAQLPSYFKSRGLMTLMKDIFSI